MTDTVQQQDQPKCPLDDEAKQVWLKQHASSNPHPMPDHEQPQQPLECSSETLKQPTPASNREISTIPRTGTEQNWIYPSESQFYQAMKRKNWNPDLKDMQTVVPLHNSINERVWHYIKNWEKDAGGDACGGIKLSTFKGDSHKWTPRAWIRYNIFQMSKPFDRHDWQIDRCGKTIDYVIDFYCDMKKVEHDGKIEEMPNVYLDVRPKLNSWEGIKLRLWKTFKF
ncbi:hypothetical protein NCAS_0H03340 [Naumovozyma castellii]|uniref:Holocytochrome c-type synthase n=1 Tax=Naumovozyma castellii TaxID=27288 RepID=G0VJG5_NAUCA|nr:hypothetical protein NCAS_0H03340 [Naumovozyma castellii CBS 4309]CCC71644.1 hypothetical protein NCAS_0H03340 [Naumovozyma castellii CBS 4309]